MTDEPLILGSAPLSEMDDETLRRGIEQLQTRREALRAEAIAKKKREEATGIKEKVVREKSKTKVDKDNAQAEALRILMGND